MYCQQWRWMIQRYLLTLLETPSGLLLRKQLIKPQTLWNPLGTY